jgi:hypothetical protein
MEGRKHMSINQITATREGLYGGPLSHGKRFHYVARLNGTQVATGETKEQALENAADELLGAFDKRTATIYASMQLDGTINTTREYAPGQVEFNYHRGPNGEGRSTMMSRLEIDGRAVSVAEFHKHYVESYRETIAALDTFTLAYIEAALWSSTDDNGEPMDANYSIEDLAPETLARMVEDCQRFQADTAGLLIDDNLFYWPSDGTGLDGRAGHDFWLTRNGHGAGFWNGDWIEPAGTKLTDAAKAFGEFNLYVGEGGKVEGQ